MLPGHGIPELALKMDDYPTTAKPCPPLLTYPADAESPLAIAEIFKK